jgi:hypothetical protein
MEVMLKPATVKVDGEEYTLGHWSPDKALEVWAWLLANIGDGAKELFSLWLQGEATQEANAAELGLKALGIIIDTLKRNVPPQVYADRMMSFCSDIVGPKGRVDPRTYFMGRMLHMHKLVVEVLRFQYADFLDEALSRLK